MDIREKIRAAAAVPEAPFWSGLVASLAMAGAKIVPEDLWDALGEWACDSEDPEGEATGAGFAYHENHARSESHESWQAYLVKEIRDTNPGKDVWLVPCDELACLAQDDEELRDLVSIERLSLVGTEQELRGAVARLIG